MRVVRPHQTQLGDLAIANIQFDIKSRDDIPQLLKGLQYIYVNDELRNAVFTLLENHIQPDKSNDNGRPGMDLWSILVMGVLRLDLNWDYDRLYEQVNNHRTIRQMLGHADFFDTHSYHLQTLKDNVCLLTPQLLDEINQVVVTSGHALVKKKENEVLRGRCDSFVAKTNVHYPTDINILNDAMRKVITLTARLCEGHGISTWRQHASFSAPALVDSHQKASHYSILRTTKLGSSNKVAVGVVLAHCNQRSSTDRYRKTLPLGLSEMCLGNQAGACQQRSIATSSIELPVKTAKCQQ